MNVRLKQMLKTLVFLWGAISLLLIIGLILFAMISNFRDSNKRLEKTEESIYQATFGDVKLDIVRKSGEEVPEIFINLAKNGKNVVSNYLLPTQEKGFDFVEFDDSIVIPIGQNQYKIVLFSAAGDCDQSTSQIWFLRFDGQMKFIMVDDLSDMRRNKSGPINIVGNKVFYPPYVEGYEYQKYIIPVEISAIDTITITPLLNDRGIKLLRADFEKDLVGRRDKLSKDPDPSKLKNFDEVQQEFIETLRGRRINW